MQFRQTDIKTEQQNFMDQLQKITGDTITSLQLAELRADKNTYAALNLELQKGYSSIWGLICFGQNYNYFYQAPQETYLAQFMQRRSLNNQRQEKVINLSDLKAKYSLMEQKKLDFLRPEKKRTVNASFTDRDSHLHQFSFILSSKAEDILPLLQK